MKKLSVLALALFGLMSAQAQAANWRYMGTNNEGNTYYYDANVKKMKNGGRWTWVKYKVKNGYHRTLSNGTKYDEIKEQWVYSCDGITRIDDQRYYYENEQVATSLGKGKEEQVIPGSFGEELEKIICRR